MNRACGEAIKWVWLFKVGVVLNLLNNGLFHLMTKGMQGYLNKSLGPVEVGLGGGVVWEVI